MFTRCLVFIKVLNIELWLHGARRRKDFSYQREQDGSPAKNGHQSLTEIRLSYSIGWVLIIFLGQYTLIQHQNIFHF